MFHQLGSISTPSSGMPLAEGSDKKIQGKQGEFSGKEAIQARVEAFLTKLDTDDDGTLTMEEFLLLLLKREAEQLAGKPNEEVVEMLMGFFGAVSTDILCLGYGGPLTLSALIYSCAFDSGRLLGRS